MNLNWLKRAASRFAPATKLDALRILMKISELAPDLVGIKTQVTKIAVEQQTRYDAALAKITQLEGQLADAEIPEEAATTLTELKAAMQLLDDSIPDTTA